jgi:hypothetical protein
LSLFHQSYTIHRLQKFTDPEDLHLHHHNIYNSIMRKRIADFSLDSGFIVGLVLAGLRSKILISNLNVYFTDYFSAVEGGLWHIYQTLHFEVGRQRGFIPDPTYLMLLTEFLADPGRAGEHAIDGPKCALAASFLLDFLLIRPSSERNING